MISNICPLGDFILGNRQQISEQGNGLSQVPLFWAKRNISKKNQMHCHAAYKLALRNLQKEAFISFWTTTALPNI